MWAQSAREVGKIVAAGRNHRGLTQAQLAREVGVTQHWISQIEQGKDSAQIGKIMRVLSFLGVRLQVAEAPWIAGRSKKPARTQKSRNISLADIIAAHSGASVPRGKARR